MIVIAFVIWLLAHVAPHAHWAVETWSWMCHNVLLTILILVVAA